MNSGATSERVYDALKRRILDRAYRPGDRLDAAVIGEALNSSVTPVRDALHVLSGERLIDARTSEGFHLPPLDAPALEDLYQWNAQVLDIAIRCWRPPPYPALPPPLAEPADQTAALFAALAGRSTNAEHHQGIASLNDRLHAIRITEGEVLAGGDEERAGLLDAAEHGDGRGLRSALGRYHRQRHRHAAAIVRALYRTGRN